MSKDSIFKRNPIIPFIILVIVLPIPILFLDVLPFPFELILIYASWTPNLAAFIVLGLIIRKKGGIKQLVSRWGKWRVGAKWYFFALSPLIIALFATWIFRLLGGASGEPIQPLGQNLVMSLILSLITGAMGEELGWRGFLLPKLQERFNALNSTLIVGVIWAFWHLPLWTIEGQIWESIPYWSFALFAISSSVLYTFVLNNTGGSLFLASLIHLATNVGLNYAGILGLVSSPGEFLIIQSLLFTLLAIILIAVYGAERLSKASSSPSQA